MKSDFLYLELEAAVRKDASRNATLRLEDISLLDEAGKELDVGLPEFANMHGVKRNSLTVKGKKDKQQEAEKRLRHLLSAPIFYA